MSEYDCCEGWWNGRGPQKCSLDEMIVLLVIGGSGGLGKWVRHKHKWDYFMTSRDSKYTY